MGCDYCKENGKEIASCYDRTTGVYKSGNKFKIFYTTEFWGEVERSIEFDYCPKCGRKLEE